MRTGILICCMNWRSKIFWPREGIRSQPRQRPFNSMRLEERYQNHSLTRSWVRLDHLLVRLYRSVSDRCILMNTDDHILHINISYFSALPILDAKKKYYKVVYEDGDAEDLFGSDVKEIVVKAPTKRSSKKRKAANEQEEEFEVAETTSGRWAGSVRKKKRRRNGNGDYVHVYLCKEEGCTNHSKQGGVCLKHGAKLNSIKPTCKHVGCNKYPRRGGFCVSHGGSRS